MSSSDYTSTIGLEIHAELKTQTKMFCASKNDAAEKRPNTNVCPVCMAHPGTLPVINRAAVELVLRVGTALGSKLADYTEFDRKNYFYPDLPKGYQLSQFEYPLVSGGSLNGINLTRIHLEEDTASSVHDENSDATLIDYNRAGVPLMELVTEPVIHSAEAAGNFGRELQLLLRYLGASEADMEKGQMRLEANISVAKISGAEKMQGNETMNLLSADGNSVHGADEKSAAEISAQISEQISSAPLAKTPAEISQGTANNSSLKQNNSSSQSDKATMSLNEKVDLTKLGTKVEVKNINSFRAMERAIQYEVKRQIEVLEKGGKVVQETRGWDENKQMTFSQRVKEGSADYRYFPDPDLPSLKLSELGLTRESIEKSLPELPWQRRARYAALGINTQDVELYVKDALFGSFFEEIGRELNGSTVELKLASNYIANDLVKLISDIRDDDTRGMKILDKMPISASAFIKLIRLVSEGALSSRSAKDILVVCIDGTSDPEQVARERDLLQDQASTQIEPAVAKIIADNASVVADWKAGKTAALEFLVGQGMKALRGAANPKMLRDELQKQMLK